MSKKYFICDFARSDSGKTTVLNQLAKKLKQHKEIVQVDSDDLRNGDMWYLFEYKGKKICIITSGDNSKDMEEWYGWALDYKVDVVVCASRSKGETIGCVNEYAEKGDYYVVWLSNYYCNSDESIIDTLNDCTAESIMNMIEKLLNIKF
ncbi:MAG: zeta toxin family protein [Bacteroidales bacterium]|jgi:nicotinic acid mononucleotide adenylyltransferase|nr:zeta toxin family protein [Bacteroidales bacterium]MCQ2960488.1 zeta toxin family protein [Bacteroidales bacterium]